ncbi:hypothetical protein FJO69_02665 [[Mycoplasma] falconis]|uniref:Uncharacterized protein n=1 Tax=[Mycoplasma] falconis TaxID=92403 RepID=A0A501X978_9BACT|nr:hypothetical protein [[Mycoplasma] falconis]TPE56923.1 hypothetical protein FJO69_02665 [[Mycoplasma] falconis]
MKKFNRKFYIKQTNQIIDKKLKQVKSIYSICGDFWQIFLNLKFYQIKDINEDIKLMKIMLYCLNKRFPNNEYVILLKEKTYQLIKERRKIIWLTKLQKNSQIK